MMKKYKLFVCLVLSVILFCMFSCEETGLVDGFSNSTTNTISKDQLKTQFGFALAKVLADDKDVREIVKNEALKQINYDYDVLYLLIKNRKNRMGSTVAELLSNFISADSLAIITDLLPNLTIFVPKLPEDAFSAEIWDTSNMIPKVAIRLDSSNDVPILNKTGKERVLVSNEIPLFPVVVVKENERIITNSSTMTRQGVNDELGKSGLTFLDSSFDNLSVEKQTRSRNRPGESIYLRPGAETKIMDPRFAKLKGAYEKYPDGTGWQRDYIYYNISPANPNGPFQYQYKEYLWGFEMVGDALGAIKKISDQSEDPQFIGNLLGGGGNRTVYSGSGWTDGEFEFKVKTYVASQTAVGNEFITYFRIDGSDLFAVVGRRKGDVYTISRAKNERVLFKNPIPLFSWDLENYSSTIKIAIEEVDATETITQTNSTTSEFATNFGFDKTFGETLKLGAKFGASAKTSKTVTYQVSTTKGNDELGEVIINFGDKILENLDSMGYPDNNSNYFLNLSSQYNTGWYRLFIAPGPIN